MNMTVHAFFLIKLIEYMSNDVSNTFICNLPRENSFERFCRFYYICGPLCSGTKMEVNKYEIQY